MLDGDRRHRRRPWLWPLLAAALFTPARADDGVGARIYARGIGGAPIKALLAGGKVETPGSRFACVNCHKVDGRGVLEGGLRPRTITWDVLTRPREAGGRGYDEASLARAVTDGIDADGAPLGPGMPRYRMDPADVTAVIGFLRGLEASAEPGISGEAIRLATLLPLQGRLTGPARSVERFLDLAVLDLNTRRRFGGRRVTRASVSFDPDVPGDAHRALATLLAEAPPFAFLSNLGIGPGDPVRAEIAKAGIPDIAPLAAPLDGTDRDAIWIEPSVADQAAALVETALLAPEMPYAGRLGERALRLGLLWGRGPESGIAAAAVRRRARELGVALVIDEPVASLQAALNDRSARPDAVLLFGSAADAVQLLEAADRTGWRPVLLGLQQQIGALEQDRVAQRRGEIFMVTSYGGVDPLSRGSYDFRRVAGELGGGYPGLLRDAYVGAKLVERTLATVGPDLTRRRFLETIAATEGFVTGVMPPLSFGQNASRRGAIQLMWLDPSRGRLVPPVRRP